VARIDLGLSDDEFWRLVPRQYAALLKRRREVNRRADLRAGIVAAVIANAHRGKDSQPFRPKDFMVDPPPAAAPRPQTPAEMLAMVETLNALFGGEDRRGRPEEGAE
jgi:hypothetical protein